jgi:hypothetical protein
MSDWTDNSVTPRVANMKRGVRIGMAAGSGWIGAAELFFLSKGRGGLGPEPEQQAILLKSWWCNETRPSVNFFEFGVFP